MRSGYVALIGKPNTGKSTLMNSLIGQDIAITSRRMQTTRNRIETVYTDKRGQIIFMDTPGIFKPQNKLGEYMERAEKKALRDADLILLIVEPIVFNTGKGTEIFKQLNEQKEKNTEVLIVINKIDKISDEKLAGKIIASYEGLSDVEGVLTVSALYKKNLDLLMDKIFKCLPEGPLYYDEETLTLMPMRKIVEELIRKQFLKYLSDEIPHGVAVVLTKFSSRRKDLMDIEADIICEKDQHKAIIIGKGGGMLKRISSSARMEIEKELKKKIYLRLFVKVRKNWRDKEIFVRSYGFSD